MDFSLKQALAVAVVVVCAGLILVATITLTKTNTAQANKQTSQMWSQAQQITNSVSANAVNVAK